MTEPLSVGARYDPDLDAWTPMADDGAPASLNPPPSRLGVWTGDAAVFWDWFQDGARYYPKEDRWLPVSPSPGGVLGREAVVGRGRVITWTISTLAVYHPGDDAWFTPSMRCGPTPRYRPLLTCCTASWVGVSKTEIRGELFQQGAKKRQSKDPDGKIARLRRSME
jgi:hypothetical protein